MREPKHHPVELLNELHFITKRLINIQCENNCLQNINNKISSLQIGAVRLLCINIDHLRKYVAYYKDYNTCLLLMNVYCASVTHTGIME